MQSLDVEIHGFYSDPHFYHKNIIEYSNRPFSSMDEMVTTFVKKYNEKVKPSDTILWVGDCFFSSIALAQETLSQLNGTKVLVRGNHDRSPKQMRAIGFVSVWDSITTDIVGIPTLVCHYPHRNVQVAHRLTDKYSSRRPERVPGRLLIHGHSHSRERFGQQAIHVGVDAWDYSPVLLDEVIQALRTGQVPGL